MRRLVLALGASIAWVHPGLAQQTPDPHDALPPPPVLESWYAVLQGRDKVGYAYESIQRTGVAIARYDYVRRSQALLETPDPGDAERKKYVLEFLSQEAKLDDALLPVSVEMTANPGDADRKVSLFSTDAGVQVVHALPDGKQRQFHADAGEELHVNGSLSLMAMRQDWRLAAPGPRRGRVLHPWGADASVAEVLFEAHGGVERVVLGGKTILTKVVWTKPPPSASPDRELLESYVDRYGRSVEEAYRGGIRVVLVEGEAEALKGLAMIPDRGRSDPMDKSAAMNSKGRAPGVSTPPKGPRVSGENLEGAIVEAQRVLQALQAAHEAGLEDQAKSLYEEAIGYYLELHPLVLRRQPGLLGRTQEIKAQAERIWDGAGRLVREARPVYVQALEDFERESCLELEKKLVRIRGYQKRPEVVLGAEEHLATLRGWAADLEPRVVRCRTRMELARKKVLVTGTARYFQEVPQRIPLGLSLVGHEIGDVHEVRFIRAEQLAVINGKPYRVGEIVEGEGVRVERIWTHGVQVSLREETRDVPLRQ